MADTQTKSIEDLADDLADQTAALAALVGGAGSGSVKTQTTALKTGAENLLTQFSGAQS